MLGYTDSRTSAIEEEVRKRTFWCNYMWDRRVLILAGHHWCGYVTDVSEPAAVDDEFITHDYIGPQSIGTPSRMRAFICVLQLLNGVGRTTIRGLW